MSENLLLGVDRLAEFKPLHESLDMSMNSLLFAYFVLFVGGVDIVDCFLHGKYKKDEIFCPSYIFFRIFNENFYWVEIT
jgi:hypothetical protein